MRAPSACATASGGVLTPRATCCCRAARMRSVAVPDVVAMAPSSPRVTGIANGSLVGLFRRLRPRGELEGARLDALRRGNRGSGRLGGPRLVPAREVDAERDLAARRLGGRLQLRLLAQLVD